MAGRYDRTSMGGGEGRFATTAWTQLVRIQQPDSPDAPSARAELANLLGRYWKPVYCYLRRKGQTNEAAKDLTQGFFSDVLLGRGLIAQADRAKGRFRTFLLTALDRYVRDAHRAERAAKRTPAGPVVALDALEDPGEFDPPDDLTPEKAFDHQWAAALLDAALAEVKAECARPAAGGKGDMTVHWQVFFERVVQPIFESTPPPSLADLCRRHGIRDEVLASNMLITVKRRFQAALRRHVRPFVETDDQVDAEIGDLIGMLSAGAGG